jgi:regulator of protease activity HflC (stomatin/prohibitin superfamily)
MYEHWGEFRDLLLPGLHCMCWPVNKVAGRLSLRVRQADVTCETLTSDHVFCHVTVTVLYKVAAEKSYDAYYRLGDPRIQISAYVLDAVRSTVPTVTLDHIFESKDEIANAVQRRLRPPMYDYGYEITSILIRGILPNDHVKASMNEIQASKCYKAAAAHRAEAAKVQVVKEAEAHAERLHLNGAGLARERRALAKGMEESAALWTEVDVRLTKPPDWRDVLDLLLVTQYMDVLMAVKADEAMFVHAPARVEAMKKGFSWNKRDDTTGSEVAS